MKTVARNFLPSLLFLTVLVSCSKDEPEPIKPDEPETIIPVHNLLKETKTVRGLSGNRFDSTIFAYEYNDSSQLIKITNKHESNTYTLIDYNGKLPVRRRTFVDGRLSDNQANFAVINGNKIILTYVYPNPPSGFFDTLRYTYSFDNNNLTEASRKYHYPDNKSNEYVTSYTYNSKSNVPNGYRFLRIINGTDSTVESGYTVTQIDNKFNPQANQSAMNKVFMQEIDLLSKGTNNIISVKSTVAPVGEIWTYEYTYDADGFATNLNRISSGYAFRQTFSY